jgi:sigma-E factor negative regulatory protein RseA
MNDQIRESLSALMDGEANELELERVLKHSDDEQLRETWARYHLASAVLMDGKSEQSNIDISARVMAAISEEPVSAIRPVGRWTQFLRPAASFAVAASVFASVLVGSQFYGLLGAGTGDAPVELADRVSTVGMVNTLGGSAVRAGHALPALRAAPTGQVTDFDKLARQRLQRYMLPHTEQSSLNAPQGMMPYARVASFQVED